MRLRALASLAVVLLTNVRVLAAEVASEPVRVDYTAPGACPGRQTFESELSERLGPVTLARFGEFARTLSVTIVPHGEQFQARVELVDRLGQATRREITAPTCEQAMRAIALVAALAARSQAEREDRERQADASTPAATTETPGAPQPPRASVRTEPAGRAPPEAHRSVAGRDERFVSFGVSVGAAASSGVGPRVAPGLFAAARATLRGATERSLVLSAMGYDTFRSYLDVADARFRMLKARLELCPVEPRLSARAFVSPCAGFELGSQTGRSYADGIRVQTPHTESGLWVAATVATRLRVRFGSLELGLGPELGIPLRRNGYTLVRPDRPVYRVPPVTLGASAGAGLAW